MVVNAFVAAIGVERTAVPLLAETSFALTGATVLATFVLAFGLTKAVANLLAGTLADRVGRRRLLLFGWALAIPVPVLLLAAQSWAWVIAANLLLGLSQGLTWSTTVVMKIARGFAADALAVEHGPEQESCQTGSDDDPF